MYLLTGMKSNKKILITYDIHRPHQEYFLLHHIEFKKYFLNYPFYAEYIGDKETEYDYNKWIKTNNPNQPLDYFTKNYLIAHDAVIGCELPKNIIQFLKENNIFYINYHRSPYRCYTQQFWSIECPLSLSNMHIPQKPKVNKVPVKIGTLLVGQIKEDRSLIKDNKFISLIDFEHIIDHLPKPIFFAPHPIGNEDLYVWAKINNYNIVNHGAYELLESGPQLVCGVSSSLLYEARDIWKLPVLFLDENQSIKNYIHLPYEIAFDHELINAILEEDEIKVKIFLGKNYPKYLSSQNS